MKTARQWQNEFEKLCEDVVASKDWLDFKSPADRLVYCRGLHAHFLRRIQAEAYVAGQEVMRAATASELVNQHASSEIDGYQAAATVDNMPIQPFTESPTDEQA